MAKERLLSLDVFRGGTIAAMILVNDPGDWGHVYAPLLHSAWNGWTFTDTIFPFFLFIVGVAIVLSLSGMKERGEKHAPVYKKIVRRTLILFALGLFLNGFPTYDLSVMRIPGVLQRIAISYFFAALIFMNTSWKGQLYWALGLMLAYWAMMGWIPVPGVGAGSYVKGANFSAYIDSLLLKGHMWSETKTWDPEGTISTLPSIATVLMGILAGHFLRLKQSGETRAAWLMSIGGIAMALGSFWSSWLPINKSIWTSSYALFMSGLATLTLGILYFLIDVRGWRRFTKPFIVYGMNAITVFVLSGIIGRLLYKIKWHTAEGTVTTLKGWGYHLFFTSWLSPYNASLAYALVFVFVSYWVMYLFYKKNIFIKI